MNENTEHSPVPPNKDHTRPIITDHDLETGTDEVAWSTVDASALEDMKAFENLTIKHTQRKRTRRKRLIITAIIIVLLLGAGFAWYTYLTTNAAIASRQAQTTTIKKSTFLNTVSSNGALKPISSMSVIPEVDGIVDTIYVTAGSVVNAGDALFTLRNDALDTSVDQATQTYHQVENSVATARVNLDNAQRNYDAAATLKNSTTALSASNTTASTSADLTTYENAVASAKVALTNAKIQLEDARKVYDDALAKAEKRTVVAPSSGTVISVNTKVGSSISSASSSSSSLIEIGDLSQMKLTIQVNEVDIVDIAVGQKAQVTFSAIPDLTLEATLTNIATSATTSSTSSSTSSGAVTYSVDLFIAQPDPRLKVGMTASATITVEHLDNVLTIPVAAIHTDDSGRKYLIIVTSVAKGTTERRMINVITSNSTTAVIQGNVAEGDTVDLRSSSTSNS
jgi:HlyD family secretion protein